MSGQPYHKMEADLTSLTPTKVRINVKSGFSLASKGASVSPVEGRIGENLGGIFFCYSTVESSRVIAPDGKETTLEVLRWLYDYLPKVLQLALGVLVVPALIALLSDEVVRHLFSQTWRDLVQCLSIYGFIIASIVFFAISLWQIFRDKRLSSLAKKIEGLENENRILAENVRAILEGYLFRLATGRLKFGERATNVERITLYVLDPNGDFVPAGRYSANPEFNRTGRDRYPAGEGCIAKAWQNEWFYETNFPCPIANWPGYVAAQAKFDISTETSERLGMRSRLYYGRRISSLTSTQPIAIVMVESTDPERFTERQLRTALSNEELEFCGRLVETVRSRIANPSDIKKMGF